MSKLNRFETPFEQQLMSLFNMVAGQQTQTNNKQRTHTQICGFVNNHVEQQQQQVMLSEQNILNDTIKQTQTYNQNNNPFFFSDKSTKTNTHFWKLNRKAR
jgi:hypothetical protein